jgi:molybdenum cofactor cytidylyltransferase
MFNAVVLAAGLSTRMGAKNKLTLNLHGQTIISSVIRNLSHSNIDQITVVVGHEHRAVTQSLSDYPQVQIVFNSLYERGQMTSIKAGVSALSSNTEGFLICLGDMPSITSEDYNFMIEQYKSSLDKTATPIVRPIHTDRVGHPVMFHSSYKLDISDAPDSSDCKLIIGKNINHYYPITVDSDNFFADIDNESEYNRLIQHSS